MPLELLLDPTPLDKHIKYLENRKKRTPAVNRAGAAYRKRLRELVLAKYGGICQCCGETHYEFLCIDHVNGGGGAERKTLSGMCLYVKLKNNPISSDYRVLCHNCNMSFGLYGYCPHTKL